jgi:Protein of unknown function (DUF2917)
MLGAHAQEMIMLAPITIEPITLAAQSVHRIENARGAEVCCVRGVTWVTQERDPRDLILAAGQSIVLDRPGLAVVYAFKDAVITVGAASQLRDRDETANLARPELQCA